MPVEYPRKYWWVVLVAVPVVVAIIQVMPRGGKRGDSPSAVAEISVSPSQLILRVGESASLSAVVRLSSESSQPGVQLRWESTDDSIVSVSSTGMVKGLKEGSTAILASALGRTGSARVTVTPAAETTEDQTARIKEDILKLTTLGIEYMRRADLSFVQAHARLPFFFASLSVATPESLNEVLTGSAKNVRRISDSSDVIKVSAQPMQTLRSRGWFPRATKDIPLPLEDSDWAGLIATTLSNQQGQSQSTTWIAIFRFENGQWRLFGVTAGEGLLE